MLRVRTGGFCIASPAVAKVTDALAALVSEDESPLAVVTDCRVELETPRRRPWGEVAATLADISWAGLSGFRRFGGVRLSRGVVAGFVVDGMAGRPVAASALAALHAWVAAADDDESISPQSRAGKTIRRGWSGCGCRGDPIPQRTCRWSRATAGPSGCFSFLGAGARRPTASADASSQPFYSRTWRPVLRQPREDLGRTSWPQPALAPRILTRTSRNC